jgi:demethylmenaquinone methyltransferase/2-methoxy-6-polyprenyl-1,4-benzoquinol methylase
MSSDAPEHSERTRHAKRLFAGLPSTYERMGALLSLGQDPRWRRFMVSRVRVPPGGRVLDVATGTGLVARHLAARTGATVIGLDQSEPMLRQGVEAAARAGLRQAFVMGRAERLPFRGESFDAVTFTYLLRYVDDPAGTLSELTRVLRVGGTLANVEFHVPPRPVWRWLWAVYTRGALPVLGRVVSPPWYEVGRFLGPSIAGFYRRHSLPDQLEMWKASGVSHVRARMMSFGAGVVIWGTKDGGSSPNPGAGSHAG